MMMMMMLMMLTMRMMTTLMKMRLSTCQVEVMMAVKKVTVTRTFLMTLTLVTRIIVVMSSTVMKVPGKTGLIWRLRLLRVTVTGLMMRKEEGEKEEVVIPLQGGKRREGTSKGQWRNLLKRSITRVIDTEHPRRSTRAGIVIAIGREKEVDHT